LKKILSIKFGFATQNFQRKNVLKNVLKKDFIFILDLPDPNYQLPLRDKPIYVHFKGAENHSVSSIDSMFCLIPPLFWQFLISSIEELSQWASMEISA
jgi:hypothetical protein